MISELAGTMLGIIACLHVTSMIPVFNFSCAYIFIRLLFSSYWYIALLYLAWWFYDRDTPFKGGRPLPIMRNFFLWKYLAKYFPATLHKTANLDPSKNYLFAFHPHGMLPYGAFINFGTNATGFDHLFPGITMHLLTVNLQFRFPFYREYVMSAGLGSIDSDSIDYKLQMGPGHSVFIAVGGSAEVLIVDPNKYNLKLKDRKGFIRKALKNGASVVPVFSFNEHRVHDVTYPEKGEIMYHVKRIVKFLFNVDIPKNARGRPWFWFLVPKSIPIDTVVGAPLDFSELKEAKGFKKGQDPPQDLVDECHNIYKDALRKLYDEHKARFGDENTPLIFV